MRERLAKIVKNHFAELMEKKLPHFEHFKIHSGHLYRWQISKDFYCYLLLHLYKQADWFTVEIAWSSDRNLFTDKVDYKAEHKTFRIQNLWGQKEDFWWMLPEERHFQECLAMEKQKRFKTTGIGFDINSFDKQMERRRKQLMMEVTQKEVSEIKAQVEDAIERIIQYAIPYFHEVAISKNQL